ncbi:MAG TPA: cobalamin-independent methionine synthase II family protein [Chloroflexota bacterium]|nr:cobalamin-independent methionine synthase II family protein [Chloroflexota bacterium]
MTPIASVAAHAATYFPTFVVGSLPRPQWIRELIEDRKTGRLSETDADKLLDTAVPSAISLQERAGLDYFSDGEWRRESYVKIFADAVDGFLPDLIPSGPASSNLMYPAVVAPLAPRRPIAADAAAFVKDHTTSRVIVAIPSPYTIARRMWSPEHSRGAYATREDFLTACVPIVRREIERLAALGVQAIQLDDPWLALLVDPAYRERVGIKDVDHEIELSIQGVNGATEGIWGSSDVLLSVHLCHAHSNRRHSTRGPYDLIIGALGRMNVHRFAMEFATPDAEGIDVLRRFPEDKILGLGVIDHTDRHVETPEQVMQRAEAAMQFVPKERLSLNTDCGFAPSSVNPMDLDEAYLKLKSLCRGAALLREKYA